MILLKRHAAGDFTLPSHKWFYVKITPLVYCHVLCIFKCHFEYHEMENFYCTEQSLIFNGIVIKDTTTVFCTARQLQLFWLNNTCGWFQVLFTATIFHLLFFIGSNDRFLGEYVDPDPGIEMWKISNDLSKKKTCEKMVNKID